MRLDSDVPAVPEIQYQKADQPWGFAMGSMYSQGLILFHLFLSFWDIACADLIRAFLFISLQVDLWDSIM